jgi:hypothetical protein
MTASPESGSKVVELSGEEPSGARKPGRRKLNVFAILSVDRFAANVDSFALN